MTPWQPVLSMEIVLTVRPPPDAPHDFEAKPVCALLFPQWKAQGEKTCPLRAQLADLAWGWSRLRSSPVLRCVHVTAITLGPS